MTKRGRHSTLFQYALKGCSIAVYLLFLCNAYGRGSGSIERALSCMTLEQKAGQMFFLSLRGEEDESGHVARHYTLTDKDKALLSEVMPGGVVLFGENIASDEQVKEFIKTIRFSLRQTHEGCTILPFISVDQEGGRVQRIKHTDTLSATTLPPMLTVGNSGKTRDAFRAGQTIGSDLLALGFNMDFAPVCDVFSNPLNTAIGDRAFSQKARTAASMSVAASKGLRRCRIIPVAKHFPGHGDTQSDSHFEQVILNKSLAQLNKTELIPFRRQIKNGAEAIMAGHITLPQFDEKPATLSYAVITGLLRGKLGFTGVVITDSMGMKAITLQYSKEDAAILAINAGCDMLLMCEDPAAVYRTVLDAVRQGDIKQARIDESVRRILMLKAKYAIAVME